MEQLKSEKVIASIQRFLLFLDLSEQSKTLGIKEVRKHHKHAIDILEELSAKKIDAAKAGEQFNDLVKKVNKYLPLAPYPQVDTRSMNDLVRSDIVAFEHFVNQEMNAGHLPLQQETELFNKAMGIWDDVGVDDTQDSVARFSRLVKKANALLPENEHYPIPDMKEY